MSGSSVWAKGGGFGLLQSRLVGMAIFVFELEEVVAARVEQRPGLGFVVVEGVAGDGRVLQVGGRVEPQGEGLFAFAFVVVFCVTRHVLAWQRAWSGVKFFCG